MVFPWQCTVLIALFAEAGVLNWYTQYFAGVDIFFIAKNNIKKNKREIDCTKKSTGVTPFRWQ